MQAGVSPNGRHNVQIRLSLPPLGQGDSSRRPEGNRSRRQHVFRVTYCTVLAEWSTAFIAVGLLSFYLFAILDTKEQGQRDNINYKVGGSAPGSAPRSLHAPLARCPCTQRCSPLKLADSPSPARRPLGVAPQLLVAYVLMSAYMRLCYILTTISKTYLLYQQGPCESSILPGTNPKHLNPKILTPNT